MGYEPLWRFLWHAYRSENVPLLDDFENDLTSGVAALAHLLVARGVRRGRNRFDDRLQFAFVAQPGCIRLDEHRRRGRAHSPRRADPRKHHEDQGSERPSPRAAGGRRTHAGRPPGNADTSALDRNIHGRVTPYWLADA